MVPQVQFGFCDHCEGVGGRNMIPRNLPLMGTEEISYISEHQPPGQGCAEPHGFLCRAHQASKMVNIAIRTHIQFLTAKLDVDADHNS